MYKYNIVTGCGTYNRVVIRYGDICHIGCWKGTKEEAIEAISEKYIGKAKDKYIDKIEQLFDPLDEITEEDIKADDCESVIQACIFGYLDMLHYLAEQGANLHTKNECGLRWATYNGHIDIVKYLQKHGANIHIGHNQPLLNAVSNGHLDIIKYLVECGAKIPTNDNLVISLAKKAQHTNIVKYLKEQLEKNKIQE